MSAVLPLWFVLPTIKCNHAVHLIVIKHVSCHIRDTFVICINFLIKTIYYLFIYFLVRTLFNELFKACCKKNRQNSSET